MQVSLGVRRDVRKFPSQNIDDFLRIEHQPGGLCLAQHPPQCDLREPTLRFGITATYIRVNACEPDLFYVLICRHRFMDQILSKKCPALINRYSMPQDTNVRQGSGVW